MCQTDEQNVVTKYDTWEGIKCFIQSFPFLCFTGLERKLFLNKEEGDWRSEGDLSSSGFLTPYK